MAVIMFLHSQCLADPAYAGEVDYQPPKLSIVADTIAPVIVVPVGASGTSGNSSPAGEVTLAGIDSDDDGVRDDVQRWIALTYPNSQKTRAAVTQLTKTMQRFLLDAADPIKSLANGRRRVIDTDCLEYVQPNNYYDIGMELRAIFLNSDTRSKAWLQADVHLSGHVFTGLSDAYLKQGCNFNPDVLPN